MLDFIAKVIAVPIRIINIPVKTIEAILNASIGEPVKSKKNALDDIADVVEESVKNVGAK